MSSSRGSCAASVPLPLPRWAVPLQLLHPQAAVLLLLLLCWLSLLLPSPQRFVSCFPPSAPEHSLGGEGCQQAEKDMQGGLRCLACCRAAQKASGSCPWLLSSLLAALLPVWHLPEPCPARGAGQQRGRGVLELPGLSREPRVPGVCTSPPAALLPGAGHHPGTGQGCSDLSLSLCLSLLLCFSVRPSLPPVSCNISSDGEAASRGPSVAPAS